MINFLHQVAKPFVLLVEIELAIRRIITNCLSNDDLKECLSKCLDQLYTTENMPTCVEEMTFNDYVQVIGDGRSWIYFEQFFGDSRGHRKRTRNTLQKICELRNVVFHFRGVLKEDEFTFLNSKRDWLLKKASIFEDEQPRELVSEDE